MLIRFSSKTGPNVSMYEVNAAQMLRMMKRSGNIPGALKGEDVAAALDALQTALEAEKKEREKENDAENMDSKDDDEAVNINTRAYPLIQLLKHADSRKEYIMWDYEKGLL